MDKHPLSPLDWAFTRAAAKAGWRGPVRWLDRAGPSLLALLLLIVVPFCALQDWIGQGTVSQLGRYCCLAVAAIGLDLVWGYAGILCLCQMLFFCLGGYACGMYLCMNGGLDAHGVPEAIAYLSSDVGGFALPWFWQPFVSPWFAVVAIVAIPGIFAAIFGYCAFRSRIKGVYFSIITQALTVALCVMFGLNLLVLGGSNGLTRFTQILGAPLAHEGTKLGLYLASALLLFLVAAGALWLTRTRFGRLLVAVRDSESRLRFAGYDPVWFKTAVFTLGAVLAAIGGALYTPQTGIITPANMKAAESLLVVVWVAVGGRGTITGAIVGALAINLLYAQLTSAVPKLWPFILGAIFVGVVLYLPNGLVGTWRRLMARIDGKEIA
jgi:urea transport system permease protein